MIAKPRRRTFTAEYKRRVVKEADARATPDAVGALPRREGLYSSHLAVWRRVRGELTALTPNRRGRKVAPGDPRDCRIAGLARMATRVDRAEGLVELETPATLLGHPLDRVPP